MGEKMIINLNEAFSKQRNLVAFNFFNIENMTAILEGAKKTGKIVILSFGESYISHTPLSVAAAMSREYSKIYDLPFVLHLDHAENIDNIKEAIELGFSSVMYDGSKLSLDENISNTVHVVKLAREHNVTVEGELGYLNEEDGSNQVEIVYTTVEDSVRFVKETGVDALAIAIGNAHGPYRSKPEINTKRICEISEATGIPLVLHGSSGISEEVLRESFSKGIRKINVNTELAIAGSKAAYEYIKDTGSNSRLENAMKRAKEDMEKAVVKFINTSTIDLD